jgi:hypothetical protein
MSLRDIIATQKELDVGQITMTFLDRSKERASVNLPIPDLDVANVATYIDGGTAYNALEAAVLALTLLTQTGASVLAESSSVPGPVVPTDDDAQRERALLFFLADTGGHKTRISIPGISLTGLTQPNTDDIPLDVSTEIGDMVTAIETHCRDSVTGLAVTVYNIRHVGRNK